MTGGRIYLDHVASAPPSAAARTAMAGVMDLVGNPSSAHAEGRRARECLEGARSRVATVLGCRPREVLFAASGTVASQLAVLGAARARHDVSSRVVLSDIEHPAVGEAADLLGAEGFDVVRVPPEADGTIDPQRFLDAVGATAAVTCLMLANHETGVRLPVGAVAPSLRARGIPLVCDACLAPGRVASGASDLDADLISLSGHKFGGPCGIGILYVRRRTRVLPLWRGGLQEERLVPGTEDVVAAVGASVALEEAVASTPTRAVRDARHVASFLETLRPLDAWSIVGRQEDLLPGVVTLEIAGVEGEAAMINLDLEGVAVSTGSACALGGRDPSPTLLAMGFTRRRAASTLRISVGDGVDESQVRRAGQALVRIVSRLRALARP